MDTRLVWDEGERTTIQEWPHRWAAEETTWFGVGVQRWVAPFIGRLDVLKVRFHLYIGYSPEVSVEVRILSTQARVHVRAGLGVGLSVFWPRFWRRPTRVREA